MARKLNIEAANRIPNATAGALALATRQVIQRRAVAALRIKPLQDVCMGKLIQPHVHPEPRSIEL